MEKTRESLGQLQMDALSAEVKSALLAIPYTEISDGKSLVDKPLVSVVIITYNQEQYVEQAIESILMQKTSAAFELLIAEDCSTDRTRELVLRYQRLHPSLIRVIVSDSNVGPFPNVARAYARCRGKYVALCEGDDYWLGEDRLEKQVVVLENDPSAGMCAGMVNVVETVSGVEKITRTYPELSAVTEFRFPGVIYVHTSTRLMTRDTLQQALNYYGRVRPSESALLYIISHLSKVVVLPVVLSVYRITRTGIWTSLNEKQKLVNDLSYLKEYHRHLPAAQRKFMAQGVFYVHYRLLRLALRVRSLRDIVDSAGQLGGFCLRNGGVAIEIALSAIKKRF